MQYKKFLAVLCALPFLAFCSLPKPASTPQLPVAMHGVPLTPIADHHQHIFSETAARGVYAPVRPEVALPAELSAVLRRREQAWNDAAALKPLFAADAAVLNEIDEDLPSWVRGATESAEFLAQLFAREYRIKPIAYRLVGSAAHVEGYYYRPDADRHIGHAVLALQKDRTGNWKITTEAPAFPGPPAEGAKTAQRVIGLLDEADIRRAAILSTAYWYGSAFRAEHFPVSLDEEYALVRSENDWVAAQISQYRDRLVGFCSFNPYKQYALPELERCTRSGALRGLKLHLGNARLDWREAPRLARLREIFAAANTRRIPIIVHLWTGPQYEQSGGEYARLFIDHVLSAAPDIPVQIAHMAGGGRSTLSALEVFAAAIAAGDPRTANLYFEMSGGLTEGQSPERLRKDAELMRKIGIDRILYGSDAAEPRLAWALFRMIPLSDEEFRAIASNVAPYLR